ncbi:hypothetical protein [Saccharopolyspora taberi]|uniref:DUF4352 domain-containing protein n=1 Tax=Saccharopolyspora taberi TaxID=60895 RepID=A0ABN3VP51_9PSEU
MKRLIAPVAFALLVGLSGCAGGSSDSDATPPADNAGGTSSSETSEQGSGDDSAGGKTAKFGEAVQFAPEKGTTLKVTLKAPTDQAPFEAVLPAEGKYVFVDAEATLVNGIAGVIGGDEFVLVDAKGNRYEEAPASIEHSFIEMLTKGGEPGSGTITYDVPADTDLSTVKIEWAPTDSNEQPLGTAATWSA